MKNKQQIFPKITQAHIMQLKAFHIEKYFYENSQKTTVLSNISVTFERNKSYAICGASGVGKSTLIHLLSGLDTPSSGTIVLQTDTQELPVTSLDPQNRILFISLVTQNAHVIKELTVLENLLLAGKLYGLSHEQALQEAQLVLQAVELEKTHNWNTGSLSGGQKQRIAIARALLAKPAFLLADEPTGNLDPLSASLLIELLLNCKKNWGMGLIISTHSQHIKQQLDIVFSLENGILVPVY